MSTHSFTLKVKVHERALTEFNETVRISGLRKFGPPVSWDADELMRAVSEGIAECATSSYKLLTK